MAGIIGPSLKKQADIIGQSELNALLNDHPKVVRAHCKLWLSSSAVLDSILNASSHAFTATTKQEIAAKVRVYAQNSSLADAQKILEKHHVLIVSGPPGVGKTTLAEMLAFAHISEEWDLIAIRNLDDRFTHIDDSQKQIFFFDDFLGSIALDRQALASTDSVLATFMNRIRNSPNARFVLTTRAYILNEAQGASDRLADSRVDISTYVLDMGSYTRGIRARILYNHLLVGNTPQTHINALLDSGKISKIVDHDNYNPRVIEWMTDVIRLGEINAEDYPKTFLSMLKNPKKLWDAAFQSHISPACRHLLISLFFSGRFGENTDGLRDSFKILHDHLCKQNGIPQGFKDYEESLRTLEGGFVRIDDGTVDFINPSLRDYLADYLIDGSLLQSVALSATTGDMASALWKFVSEKLLAPDVQAAIALQFKGLISTLKTAAHWKDGPDNTWVYADLSNSRRIELLLEWWSTTSDEEFVTAAIELTKSPPQRFSAWKDATSLLEIIAHIDDDDYVQSGPQIITLKEELERAVIKLINDGIWADELVNLSDAVEKNTNINPDIKTAVTNAIIDTIDNIGDTCEQEESESTLSDYSEAIKKLAPRANVSGYRLDSALMTIDERIGHIEENSVPVASPSTIPTSSSAEDEKFDDGALNALFTSLRA